MAGRHSTNAGRHAAASRLTGWAKRAGDGFLRASIVLDKAIGTAAEKTGKLMAEHKIGTAHTIGVLAVAAGAGVLAKGWLDFDFYDRTLEKFHEVSDQQFNGHVGPGDVSTETLVGSSLIGTGVLSSLVGMTLREQHNEDVAPTMYAGSTLHDLLTQEEFVAAEAWDASDEATLRAALNEPTEQLATVSA